MPKTERTAYRTFEKMTEDAAWEGWGYIGGRNYELEEHPNLVADADAQVIRHAIQAGWTDGQLFDWANSRNGRWFADAITDPAYRELHAASLLVLP